MYFGNHPHEVAATISQYNYKRSLSTLIYKESYKRLVAQKKMLF